MAIARGERGVHETPGKASTKRINEYLATVSMAPNDEIPWCSAFVNWVMRKANLPGAGKARARSWLSYGAAIDPPKPGAIAVLWRGKPTAATGHVGFYIGEEDAEHVLLLGGNQANAVNVSSYPKNRVLAYRWPDGQ
ncbi:MAG: TIGR02594 family protein [Deltaproteobacteria bacterium]|nr:TIGR02594 family protein [Deltaproteobacteria bacterium]